MLRWFGEVAILESELKFTSGLLSWGMKNMPMKSTQSMAQMVSSCNQAFRVSSRSREVDDEAPQSKRTCASGGRVYGSSAIERVEAEKWNQSGGGFGELVAFGPGTPTKDDEVIDPVRKLSGGWDSLELCLLERVTRSLSASDLCRLAQVLVQFLLERSK